MIAFSPSSVVWQGIPANRFKIAQDVKSSWTFEGEGLPFLAYPAPIRKLDLMLLRLRRMHEDALRDRSKATEAAIPGENIQGAILLISGERDRLWPATYMSEQIVARLNVMGFGNHCEHIAFNSGHNGIVMNRKSWRKIFDFLDEHYL